MESFAFPDKLKLKKFQIRMTKFMIIFQAVEFRKSAASNIYFHWNQMKAPSFRWIATQRENDQTKKAQCKNHII